MKRRALLLLLSLGTAPAIAQSDTPEIVVTGSGLARAAGDAAYDAVTIDRSRITGEASGRLEDLLRDAAGFAQYRRSDARSAQPTSQGATLRGLGGNASSRALVLLDGVPQTDPFGGWISWSALDPRRLGLARVTRGGGSGIYGPGALAGTIELESAGPNDLSPVWASLAYGSRDSVDADAGVSGKLGGGFAFIAGGYSRSDGFIPLTRSTRGPIDERAPYEQGNVAARAAFPVGNDAELQANGLAFSDHRTRGVPGTPNSTKGANASLRLIGRGRWGYEALAYVQTRTFSSGFAAATDATRTAVNRSLDQYNVPGTGIGGRIEIRPPLGSTVQLRIGTDTRLTRGRTEERVLATNTTRIAGGRTATLGGFAEASVEPTDTLTLTGGARVDRWWISDGTLRTTPAATDVTARTDYANRSGWEPTGRAGIAWKPAGAITLRTAGYIGWRLPTLNELYRPFRVGNDSTVANAALKPETVKGIDGGVDWTPLPALRLSATLFWNRLDDAIANVTSSINPATGGRNILRQNIDAVESKGVEFDGRLSVGDWRVLASYSLADARVHASGTAAPLDGLRPAQTARQQASATLAWAPPRRLSASVTLRYIGPQYEDDQNDQRLKDALVIDATALLPIGHGFAIEARAENLANALIETTLTGPLVERSQPRTLWIGVRYGG